ncbi:hypothetical protein L1N82_10360 [Paenibacillus tarimensis]|nr:hypothetical protein [Paenibacillus tarimensis]
MATKKAVRILTLRVTAGKIGNQLKAAAIAAEDSMTGQSNLYHIPRERRPGCKRLYAEQVKEPP